ncbi:MAG: hypothetical protein RLY49_51 [Candidatus Parcubacteria bacterium]|jgi:hypothetical protein
MRSINYRRDQHIVEFEPGDILQVNTAVWRKIQKFAIRQKDGKLHFKRHCVGILLGVNEDLSFAERLMSVRSIHPDFDISNCETVRSDGHLPLLEYVKGLKPTQKYSVADWFCLRSSDEVVLENRTLTYDKHVRGDIGESFQARETLYRLSVYKKEAIAEGFLSLSRAWSPEANEHKFAVPINFPDYEYYYSDTFPWECVEGEEYKPSLEERDIYIFAFKDGKKVREILLTDSIEGSWNEQQRQHARERKMPRF